MIQFKETLKGSSLGYHFAVMTSTYSQNGIVEFDRKIVIKNGDNILIENGITNFASYVHPYHPIYKCKKNPTEQELISVCIALNFFWRNGIEQLSKLNIELVERFYEEYRLHYVNGDKEHFVNNKTFCLCVKTVSNFLANLSRDNIIDIPPESLVAENVTMRQNGKREIHYKPIYNKKASQSEPITRIKFIPKEAIDMMISFAKIYYPMISFGLVLQRDAGFRVGEVMNIRQENSPLSNNSGVQYIKTMKIIYFGVDLTREFILRSDNRSVGLIKRNTTDYSPVYEKNLETVWNEYQEHLRILERTKFEKEFCPMFVNSNGYAMTQRDYRYLFNQLIMKYVRPELLRSNDSRLVSFGNLLQNYPIGPHVLRHYFSVMLVLDGADTATIMRYRGDKNPNSALAYLQGKNLFSHTLEETNSLCLTGLTSIGDYIYDNF